MRKSPDRQAYQVKSLPALFISAVVIVFMTAGCSGHSASSHVRPFGMNGKILPSMRYSIQVGSLSDIAHAERLVDTLIRDDLDAYYFLGWDGRYKVRFGNYVSGKLAERQAEILKSGGVIDDYHITPPGDDASPDGEKNIPKEGVEKSHGGLNLRDNIVKTARNFIGIPYKWGGTVSERGLDCSGLTMAVYRLNGLNLPRSSKEQYSTGIPVKRNRLVKGDLIFFATSFGRRISHVGIYAGNGEFVHSPGKGKRVCIESLSNSYYKKRYVGARRYF